ncbi:MAG: putative ABC transport system permease protein, partial [Candidatus Krumholzibacteriia bacterium]
TVVGTVSTFAEELLVPILSDQDVAAAWPICKVDAAWQGDPSVILQIIGADLLAPIQFPLESKNDTGRVEIDVVEALRQRDWIAVSPEMSDDQGWALGDTIVVSSGSRTASLVIGAFVDFKKIEPLAPRALAVMDIANVQEQLARIGLVHQIDIKLLEGADVDQAADRMASRLGPSVRVLTPEQRGQDAEGLLKAFRLNLTALSLISVFVGLFLVLTSVQASLSSRRREYGILRCQGASPDHVFWLILAETGGLGLLGVLLGLPMGYFVASQNLATVSATLTNIYVLEGIDSLALTGSVIALGAAVGVIGAMIGAAYPAWEMSRRDTLKLLATVNMHDAAKNSAGRLAFAAIVVMGLTGIWFAFFGIAWKWGGFILGALVMVSVPFLVPALVQGIGRLAKPTGMNGSLSLRNLVARLQTTSFAISALTVTVSMLVGITLLVGSFRETLITWLDTSVQADVYITSESWVRSGSEAFLESGLIGELAATAGVEAWEEQRRLRVGTSDGQHLIWLNGVRSHSEFGSTVAHRLPLLEGEIDTIESGLNAGQVVIGEPLARKAVLAVGDTLRLAGPFGQVALAIAGVAYDYTSEGGTAFMTMATMDQFFGKGPTNNVALYLDADHDSDETASALQAEFSDYPLVFRSNQKLRTEVLAIFDQTFAVTRTLQSLALLTAVCGVSLTLLVQSRQRTGELALLRSLGATKRQVFVLFMGEGAAMGTIGLGLGLLGGIGLAALLILVVNRQWFGWTIQPSWPAEALLVQAVTVMSATLVAAAVPAFQAGLSGPEKLTSEDQ